MSRKKSLGVRLGAACIGFASATLAPLRAADAATTFCGGGAYGTRDESIWKALKNYSTAVRAVQALNRDCLWCHTSTGQLNNLYVKSAFEADILGDWLKSSYWALGHIKATSAYLRMFNHSMPPGVWPPQTPEPTHTALQSKITDWVMNRLPACGATADCIWGKDRVTDWADPTGGLQRCSW
jgi:hypothetical protein